MVFEPCFISFFLFFKPFYMFYLFLTFLFFMPFFNCFGRLEKISLSSFFQQSFIMFSH